MIVDMTILEALDKKILVPLTWHCRCCDQKYVVPGKFIVKEK